MPQSRCNTFYHFVWATRDRAPLLTGDKEDHMHDLIRRLCRDLGAGILALNGMSDHIHLLATLPTTLCIADFMKHIKGTSSRLFNDLHGTPTFALKWQGGYSCDTICSTHIPVLVRYIESQKRHHADGKLWQSCELPPNKPNIAVPLLAREGGQSTPPPAQDFNPG